MLFFSIVYLFVLFLFQKVERRACTTFRMRVGRGWKMWFHPSSGVSSWEGSTEFVLVLAFQQKVTVEDCAQDDGTRLSPVKDTSEDLECDTDPRATYRMEQDGSHTHVPFDEWDPVNTRQTCWDTHCSLQECKCYMQLRKPQTFRFFKTKWQ